MQWRSIQILGATAAVLLASGTARADEPMPQSQPPAATQGVESTPRTTQEGIARIQELLAQMPDVSYKPWNLAYERGLVAYNQANYTEAETAFREAAQLQPQVAGYHYGVGVALAGQQKYAEAESAFRMAMQQEENVAAYHYALACALLSQQRYPDAETEFRAAQRIDPNMAVEPQPAPETPPGAE